MCIQSIDTDRTRQRCEIDGYAWRGGSAERAGRVAPACRAARGGTGAGGAAAPSPRCPRRPTPRARPPRSERTSAPLPPPHAARRPERPLRRLRLWPHRLRALTRDTRPARVIRPAAGPRLVWNTSAASRARASLNGFAGVAGYILMFTIVEITLH